MYCAIYHIGSKKPKEYVTEACYSALFSKTHFKRIPSVTFMIGLENSGLLKRDDNKLSITNEEFVEFIYLINEMIGGVTYKEGSMNVRNRGKVTGIIVTVNPHKFKIPKKSNKWAKHTILKSVIVLIRYCYEKETKSTNILNKAFDLYYKHPNIPLIDWISICHSIISGPHGHGIINYKNPIKKIDFKKLHTINSWSRIQDSMDKYMELYSGSELIMIKKILLEEDNSENYCDEYGINPKKPFPDNYDKIKLNEIKNEIRHTLFRK